MLAGGWTVPDTSEQVGTTDGLRFKGNNKLGVGFGEASRRRWGEE